MTLLALLLIAVPLKHLAGLPGAVAGPVHGVAFAFYAWTVIETIAGGGWSRGGAGHLAVAAMVPFGAFANLRWLRRRAQALVESTP